VPGPMRVVVTDIDGCVGRGEGLPYDPEVLRRLSELNQAARRGEPVPAVTLCSGRAAAYVDALMQTIAGFLPAIFENGAGLYFPKGYRFAWNPAIPNATRRTIRQIRQILEDQVVESGIGYIQPGKDLSLTFFAMPGYTLNDVGQAAVAALDGTNLPCRVEVSVTSVGVWLDGVDKGAGLQWLATETGIPLSQMIGVGDAPGDIPFLKLAGFAAAPASAEPEVKAVVSYVSPHEYGLGLLDIVEQCKNWPG